MNTTTPISRRAVLRAAGVSALDAVTASAADPKPARLAHTKPEGE